MVPDSPGNQDGADQEGKVLAAANIMASNLDLDPFPSVASALWSGSSMVRIRPFGPRLWTSMF